MRWSLNQGWRFLRGDIGEEVIGEKFDDSRWEIVNVPHTARVEPAMCSGGVNFLGTCWYRKRFESEEWEEDQKMFLEFEGAKHVTTVWLNGKQVGEHLGGYLPFVFDIGNQLKKDKGAQNTLVVRLDNRDKPEIPPGKPQEDLDFCYFAGLYRNVWLEAKSALYITHPVYVDQVASGGIFVRMEEVNKEYANVYVQTHVMNEYEEDQTFEIAHTLYSPEGEVVAKCTLGQKLAAQAMRDGQVTIKVEQPRLWSDEAPELYTLKTKIKQGKKTHDCVETSIGIRHIVFNQEGFLLNGENVKLVGANKHQEYVYIGDALSDRMHEREVIKLKEAGFNCVRTGHYPPGRAFIEACDRQGVMCIVPIPGWQYFQDTDAFKNASYQNLRDMIRYYRNHPSIILWEPILNESWYSAEYAHTTYGITHEEYPGDQCYAACDSWINGWEVYDVPYGNREKNLASNKCCFVREYADNYREQFGPQKTVKRCTRGDSGFYPFGEQAMARSAVERMIQTNRMLMHRQIAGGALWTGIDCNRGYLNNIAATGILDLYRLPKFGYYAFSSQLQHKPMVFAATYWKEKVEHPLIVFSNCEKVRVTVNGKVVAESLPNPDYLEAEGMKLLGHHIQYGIMNEIPIEMVEEGAQGVKHPPFVFEEDFFEPGTLRVEGLIGGEVATVQEIITPQRATRLELELDSCQQNLVADGADTIMVHVFVRDANGMLVPDAEPEVTFSVQGPAEIVGDGLRRVGANPIKAEAGAIGVLIRAYNSAGTIIVTAQAEGLEGSEIVFASEVDTKYYVTAPVEVASPEQMTYEEDQVMPEQKAFFNEFDRAAHKPIEASSYEEGYPASAMVDNNHQTSWRATDTSKQWILLDVGSVRDITTCKIWWKSDNTNYCYQIFVSEDQVEWREMVNNMGTGQDIKPDYFEGDSVRYIRVEITEVSKGVAEICSIQVFGA